MTRELTRWLLISAALFLLPFLLATIFGSIFHWYLVHPGMWSQGQRAAAVFVGTTLNIAALLICVPANGDL